MYRDEKQKKQMAYIIAILIFIIPILLILAWPLLGVTLTLCGIIIWQCWGSVFVKLAKKIHKFLFKEEMR